MHPLSDLLDPALHRLGVHDAVCTARLQTALAALVGDRLAPLCTVVSLRRGTLVIATSHPALAHQLRLDSHLLITRLNDHLRGGDIRRIHFAPLSTPPEPA